MAGSTGEGGSDAASLSNVLAWAKADAQRRDKKRAQRKGTIVRGEGEEVAIETPPFTVIRTDAVEELLGKGAPVVGVSGSRSVNPENATIKNQEKAAVRESGQK